MITIQFKNNFEIKLERPSPFLMRPIFISVLFMITSCATKKIAQSKTKGIQKIDYKKFKTNTILVGATLNYRELNTKKETLFLKDFKYLTPANAAKQHIIHPSPNIWNWNNTAAFLKFAEKNKIAVRLHGPISPQASWWAKDDDRTPQELETNLIEFATAFAKKYNNHPNVIWMDVVNETVLANGKWHGPKPGKDKWENPWLAIGLDENDFPLYILKAFEIATKHAPNIKLVYNQNAGMNDVMWHKVKKAILYLKSKGYRVDGLGWQAHLLLGASREDFVDNIDKTLLKLGNLIDWAHQNNLEFHVTELDYLIKENNLKNIKVEREIQAKIYQKIIDLLLSKSKNGFVSLNLWDLGVRFRKGKGYFQSIYDEHLEPTPAYEVIKGTLQPNKK
ncbi:endo-1,4-beta-xylanase [Polaribacter batillariae]|uniref:endo-1,4-beta-xylanase n=1 Tax=Polaribacter batillariae TaxID=2808900 RepID=A0ABX7SXQ6_9FLAO|nr:endo-1,4-beta-xylanase [Polaribacter batillariae]QTD38494.1 endo-1,4-beta-xylanase [Polaribacter batillariae]